MMSNYKFKVIGTKKNRILLKKFSPVGLSIHRSVLHYFAARLPEDHNKKFIKKKAMLIVRK